MILEIIVASNLSFILGCVVIYLRNAEDKHRLLHKEMEIIKLKKEIKDKEDRIDSLVEVQGELQNKAKEYENILQFNKIPYWNGYRWIKYNK